jgi:hypothetical protein
MFRAIDRAKQPEKSALRLRCKQKQGKQQAKKPTASVGGRAATLKLIIETVRMFAYSL